MKIILGSSSPRRKQLFSLLFNEFEVLPPHIDESVKPGETPENFILRMAEEKRNEIEKKFSANFTSDHIIITADTIVEYKNEILQKPVSHEDAVRILKMLQGEAHEVATAVGITCVRKGIKTDICRLEKSQVFFRKLSEADILKYLSITEYMDKAGAYAIQENGEMIVDHFEGSQTNIVGFPLRLYYRMLEEAGLLKTVFNL